MTKKMQSVAKSGNISATITKLVPANGNFYARQMKILLVIVAVISFIGPIIVWAYLVSMACAFNTSSTNCTISLSDFWDSEFLVLAALPCLVGLICLVFASRLS